MTNEQFLHELKACMEDMHARFYVVELQNAQLSGKLAKIENTLSEARESIKAIRADLRALLDNPPTHD